MVLICNEANFPASVPVTRAIVLTLFLWNSYLWLSLLQVDYGATVEELVAHFTDCGTIFRVTIMVDRYTGQPKGFAYIEFSDESSVKHATILDNTTFRGRKLKVVAKRTNVPGMTSRGGHYGRRPRYNRGGYSRGYGRRPRRGFRGRWSPY